MKSILNIFHWGNNVDDKYVEKNITKTLKYDKILKRYLSFEPGVCIMPLYGIKGEYLLIWFPYKKDIVSYDSILDVTKRIALVIDRNVPQNIKAIQIAHCLKDPNKVDSIAKLTYYLSSVNDIKPGIDNVEYLSTADLQKKIIPETQTGIFQAVADDMVKEGIYITWYWDNQYSDKPRRMISS